MNHLDQHFTWHGVCPEVESGMGTPRPTIRLVNDAGELRVMRADGTDVTEQLSNQVTRSVSSLQKRGIRGFILKKDSPSCGMERVRVYTKGSPTRNGQGVFLRALMEAMPHLPVEDEGRLNDPRLRENFMLRVFTYDRWCTYLETQGTPQGLREFHLQHKLLVRAHNVAHAGKLGRLVAGLTNDNLDSTQVLYERLLMEALSKPARTGPTANTLLRVLGFLRTELTPSDREDIRQVIADYRAGYVP